MRPPQASPTPDEDRYLRQASILRRERRAATLLVEMGGEACHWTSTFLKAGAGIMGVPAIASDYHGPEPNGHWLRGPHDQLLATVNPGATSYGYVMPAAPAMAVTCLLPGRDNAWAVVYLNDMEQALRALEGLGGIGRLRVLLVAVGPGGLVVRREPSPAAALASLRVSGSEFRVSSWGTRNSKRETRNVPPGPVELEMVAAGVCLNEMVLGGRVDGDNLGEGRTVASYILHRPRRVDASYDAGLAELMAEVARPRTAPAEWSHRRIKMVGAGALGNWTSLAIALDSAVSLEVVDGDGTVEPHNLNRQILLVHGLGRGAKAPVLAEELARLDPDGAYAARVQRVERKEELGPLDATDVLIAAPDNDAARFLCGDAARDAEVLFGEGGTGATGGQETVHPPQRPCLRCVLADRRTQAGPAPCGEVANDSIVSSNMVVAGLMVSELREALAGRRAQNVRFVGDGPAGNRLIRMTTDADCPHVVGRGARAAGRATGGEAAVPPPAALRAAEAAVAET